MRKLVTIRKIDELRPIEGADRIECALIEGWTVVVKKGEFKVGDACLFFEIDAFLPMADKRFAFLDKHKILWEGKEGARMKTLKLRGQISQGLVLPLDEFPEVRDIVKKNKENVRDIDFSEMLNVEKWEAPIPACLSGEVLGAFPSIIRKTDQERIQNMPEVFDTMLDCEFEITVKLDGSSMTVFRNNDELGVCGRNWWLKETPDNSLWKVAREMGVLEVLASLGKNYALQGELIGEGIQGNPEKLRGQAFYLFDIFDIDAYRYLGFEERQEVVNALNAAAVNIAQVPVIGVKKLREVGDNLDALLAYADGPSLNPKTRREGLVFKARNGDLSFKVISNYYLLKHGDR